MVLKEQQEEVVVQVQQVLKEHKVHKDP